MNKIEQVARALDPMSAKVVDVLLEKGLKHKDVLAILPMDKARAAIEAMRVPTEGMRKAVEKAEDDMGICHGAYEHIDWDEAWPVAIDAALEGK